MITVNTQGLTVNTNLIKAVTLGIPGNIALDKLNRTVKVGTLNFPLLPLNKLIFDSRNLLFTYEDKLCVLIDGYAHTLETVELEILPNDSVTPYVPPLDGDGNPIWEQTTYPGISQIALVSVTYGNDTHNLITGGSSQKIRMVYVKDAPIVVVATNITTGAVSTASITPGSGQRYSVKVNSTTEQIGERSEFCTQEEFDLGNAPVKLLGPLDFAEVSKRHNVTLLTHNFVSSAVPDDTIAGPPSNAIKEGRQLYSSPIYVYSGPVASAISKLESMSSQKFKLEFSYRSYPDVLYNPTAGQPSLVERPDLSVDDDTLNYIAAGKVFQVPSTIVLPGNNYTFSYSGVLDSNGLRLAMDTGAVDEEVTVELVPGKWYYLQTLNGISSSLDDYTVQSLFDPNYYRYGINLRATISTELFLFGPVEKVCTITQVNDTRNYKYASYITIGSLN